MLRIIITNIEEIWEKKKMQVTIFYHQIWNFRKDGSYLKKIQVTQIDSRRSRKS